MSNNNVHTGQFSLQIPAGQKGFTVALATSAARSHYEVSAWVHEQNVGNAAWFYAWQVQGLARPADSTLPIDMTTVRKAGSWYLFRAQIPVPAYPSNTVYTLHLGIKNSGAQSIWVDDFRAHPVNAALVGYVYNPWGELWHVLDGNNLYTEYRYDAMGRLTEVYKETLQAATPAPTYGSSGIVKVSQVDYNFGSASSSAIFSITASNTGRGEINPAGAVSVRQGGTQAFSIQEICSSPFLQRVLIDGEQVDMQQPLFTLLDGTQVEIRGLLINFRNIQGSHKIQAQFASSSPVTSGVQCHRIENCYTGSYDYYDRLDACGNPMWIYNVNFNGIPKAIRPATQPNCCAQNPSNISCACNNPQQ